MQPFRNLLCHATPNFNVIWGKKANKLRDDLNAQQLALAQRNEVINELQEEVCTERTNLAECDEKLEFLRQTSCQQQMAIEQWEDECRQLQSSLFHEHICNAEVSEEIYRCHEIVDSQRRDLADCNMRISELHSFALSEQQALLLYEDETLRLQQAMAEQQTMFAFRDQEADQLQRALHEIQCLQEVSQLQTARTEMLCQQEYLQYGKIEAEELVGKEIRPRAASGPSPKQKSRRRSSTPRCHQANEYPGICVDQLLTRLTEEEAICAELRVAVDEAHESNETEKAGNSELQAMLEKMQIDAQRKSLDGSLHMSLPTLRQNDLMKFTNNFSKLLGAGSFGKVYAGTFPSGVLAEHVGDVAVKVPVAGGTESNEQQFLREVRAGAIRDPNLVPLLAVCLDQCALVYPLASGTLEGRLRAVDLLGIPEQKDGLRILLGAARGLLALHDRNLLHRDVKSANVLLFVDDDGVQNARLGDFGWLCNAQEGTVVDSATLVGTPSYLDPEASARGACSRSSDIFSFGVILLEVLLCRSVTEIRRDTRPLWKQLNEALPLVSMGQPAVIAAAVAFIRGAGAGNNWQVQALEAACILTVDALKESFSQPRSVDRPSAAAVSQRLQEILTFQSNPPENQALAPCPEMNESSHCSERICTICFEDPVTVRFQPCCHSIVCAGCAPSFVHSICPLCRCEVESFELGQFETTYAA